MNQWKENLLHPKGSLNVGSESSLPFLALYDRVTEPLFLVVSWGHLHQGTLRSHFVQPCPAALTPTTCVLLLLQLSFFTCPLVMAQMNTHTFPGLGVGFRAPDFIAQ